MRDPNGKRIFSAGDISDSNRKRSLQAILDHSRKICDNHHGVLLPAEAARNAHKPGRLLKVFFLCDVLLRKLSRVQEIILLPNFYWARARALKL